MQTPSFNLTATERVLPRMALDFTTALLDSRVTITRALDTATAVNSSGFVAGVNANLPRFDYEPVAKTCRGLLIEELRANVCIQSGDIDNVAWSRAGVGVVGDTVTSPAGTTTGNTVTCSAGSSVHRVVSTAGAVTSGASATHSVFVKAGTHSFFQIHDGSTATFYANFNLSTGAVTAVNPANGATITPFGDGWYRCTFTLTAGTTTSIGAVCLIPDGTSARNPTWTAAGTESLYAWGYQIEVGAFATSYIPTTTTSLTRNADAVSMTGTNFSSWYNATEGTFMANVSSLGAYSFYSLIDANDGTTLNRIGIRYNSASVASGIIIVGNVQQGPVNPATAPNAAASKFVLAYKANSFAASYRGSAVVTDTSGTVPTVSRLDIGNILDSPNTQLNGHVRQVSYYPLRLTNNEVQAISN